MEGKKALVTYTESGSYLSCHLSITRFLNAIFVL